MSSNWNLWKSVKKSPLFFEAKENSVVVSSTEESVEVFFEKPFTIQQALAVVAKEMAMSKEQTMQIVKDNCGGFDGNLFEETIKNHDISIREIDGKLHISIHEQSVDFDSLVEASKKDANLNLFLSLLASKTSFASVAKKQIKKRLYEDSSE